MKFADALNAMDEGKAVTSSLSLGPGCYIKFDQTTQQHNICQRGVERDNEFQLWWPTPACLQAEDWELYNEGG